MNRKTHHVKCLQEYFNQVWLGKKTFELRKNDRDYCVGDVVALHEIVDGEDTGRIVTTKIQYVLKNCPEYGLQDGYCIFCWNPDVMAKESI